MLPVINATRGLLSKGLTEAVVKLVREPAALSQVEHALSAGDPSLIRLPSPSLQSKTGPKARVCYQQKFRPSCGDAP